MFKNGDDTRQDQLILQLLSLFDQLLRQININLPFTSSSAWLVVKMTE